jgi:hypothetical protein
MFESTFQKTKMTPWYKLVYRAISKIISNQKSYHHHHRHHHHQKPNRQPTYVYQHIATFYQMPKSVSRITMFDDDFPGSQVTFIFSAICYTHIYIGPVVTFYSKIL